jgi:hypothetical protein
VSRQSRHTFPRHNGSRDGRRNQCGTIATVTSVTTRLARVVERGGSRGARGFIGTAGDSGDSGDRERQRAGAEKHGRTCKERNALLTTRMRSRSAGAWCSATCRSWSTPAIPPKRFTASGRAFPSFTSPLCQARLRRPSPVWRVRATAARRSPSSCRRTPAPDSAFLEQRGNPFHRQALFDLERKGLLARSV